MSKVYLVWNEDRSECVGFTDKGTAEQASGKRLMAGFCSTLALKWREIYADEFMSNQPKKASERIRFDIQEIEV